MVSQAKEYNLKGYTKWNKQQLISFLSKAKKLLFKKDGLLKLTKEELKNVAKEYNIKAVLAKKKAEIIDAILKTQVSVFHDFLARELSFHNDIIEPTKGKRKPPESAFRYIAAKEFKFHNDVIEPSRGKREPAYSVTETRSRFIQKYNTT